MKKIALLLALAVMLPQASFAAIAFDSSAAPAQIVATSITFSATISGSNTFSLIGCYTQAGDTVGGASWNGTQYYTKLYSQSVGSTENVTMLYLIGPVAATANIVATSTVSTTFRCAETSYNGVSQAAIDSSHQDTANSSTDTGTTNVVATGAWLVSFMMNEAGGAFTAGTQTLTRVTVPSNPYVAIMDSNGTVGTGSQSLTATFGGPNVWSSQMVSIAPVAAAASTALNPQSYFQW